MATSFFRIVLLGRITFAGHAILHSHSHQASLRIQITSKLPLTTQQVVMIGDPSACRKRFNQLAASDWISYRCHNKLIVPTLP